MDGPFASHVHAKSWKTAGLPWQEDVSRWVSGGNSPMKVIPTPTRIGSRLSAEADADASMALDAMVSRLLDESPSREAGGEAGGSALDWLGPEPPAALQPVAPRPPPGLGAGGLAAALAQALPPPPPAWALPADRPAAGAREALTAAAGGAGMMTVSALEELLASQQRLPAPQGTRAAAAQPAWCYQDGVAAHGACPPQRAQPEPQRQSQAPVQTAMLRNIPNKYTSDMLVSRLFSCGFRGYIDFLYLPIDFKNRCNVGYAFVSFRDPTVCARFVSQFHGTNSAEMLPGFNSKKVCQVSPAHHQGREENVRRLQASPVMAELARNPEWLPRLFDDQGEPVEFPLPCGKTARAPRQPPHRHQRAARGGAGHDKEAGGAPEQHAA